MEIRDIIHGSIQVEAAELPIVDSPYFQRLRHIRQVGFAENSFPAATHTRYIHSLGAMHTASEAFGRIFSNTRASAVRPGTGALARFRTIVRLAALLHDIGHGPLSHTTEFAMPQVRELKLPDVGNRSKTRKATHEDYTLKMILDSGLTPLIEKTGQPFGFRPLHVAALIDTDIEVQDDFFRENRCDFRPVLTQLISSELDADRMDYLRRDSLNAGVSYGHFDFSWLVENLTYHVKNDSAYLALHHKALYTFEDFLISRFHMFLMVYFHHKTVIFDEMLGQYLSSADCEYELPADIEAYCETHDAHLYAHLAKSKNPWARRIIEKKPYQMLVELHSGIPATQTSSREQKRLLERIKTDLQKAGIHFIASTSTSELSKYFRKPGDPIFVHYDNHYSTPNFIPLEQCTDLFVKYGEKRSITRLYISPEDYPTFTRTHPQSRKEPLRYQEEIQP